MDSDGFSDAFSDDTILDMTFKPPRYDKYWRLNEECSYTKSDIIDVLVKAGYEVKKSWNKDELIALVHKVRKGRLCYDKFTQAELKRFAVDRGLVVADKKPTKRWSADTLMQADDERTFSKLPDLPPEMRKIIYEFYLSDFESDMLVEPSQPPLARICKMTRNEVLPLFYGICTFKIQFNTMRSSDHEPVRFRMTRSSYMFLNTLASGCFDDLRKIDILFRDKSSILNWESCWVYIDFSLGAKLCEVVSDHNMGKEHRRMKREVKKVVKCVSERGEGKKLVKQDFFALSSAVERVVKHRNAVEEEED